MLFILNKICVEERFSAEKNKICSTSIRLLKCLECSQTHNNFHDTEAFSHSLLEHNEMLHRDLYSLDEKKQQQTIQRIQVSHT